MAELSPLLKHYVVVSRRKNYQTKTGTEPRLAQAFAVVCDRPRDAERVRHARQNLAPSDARRGSVAWNDRAHPSQDPLSRRDSASQKLPSYLPRMKDRPKRMNHKNGTRVRLTAIPRHTASMFLSPVSFALRTLHLR